MAFTATVYFPWYLVEAFGVGNHFSSNSFVVHIEKSMKKYNDSEFFDGRGRCLLGYEDVNKFFPFFWVVAACVWYIGHRGIKFRYLVVLATGNVVYKGGAESATGSIWFHSLPAGSV